MSIQQLFICAGLALAAPAWAQTQAPSRPGTPVSLAQVLQAAQNNLDVSLAGRALTAARADVAAADHAPAPILSAKTASIDLQNGIGGGNLVRDKRIDKSLGIDWTWERGNKRELRTRAAQRGADAAQADVDETRVQQQLVAAAAYYDLLAAQERIAQVEAIARSAGELAGTAARRVRAGDLSRQDAARTEIEAQRAQADLRAAQTDRQRAVLALAEVTGMASALVAEGDWPTPASQALPAAPPLESRADVRAAEQRVQAAQAAFDGAQALRKSDVTLGTSFDHYPGTSTRLLELRLQVPLTGVFGNYGYEGEIARAGAQLAQAYDQLEKTRRSAATDVARQQQDLQAAAERALTYDQAIVPRARQVADMAELAYGKGAMSLTELIDARRTLRSVLLEDVDARAEHGRALAAWQLRNPPLSP